MAYKYDDVVHIKSGFYVGMFGEVVSKRLFGLKYYLQIVRNIKDIGTGPFNGSAYDSVWVWQIELCKTSETRFNEKLSKELEK